MLKGIPSIISPELIHALMSMGHGDTIVIADGNFPAASVAATNDRKLVRASGIGCAEMLDAVLQLFPLDEYDKPNAISVMQVVPGDSNSVATPPIWSKFESIAKKAEGDWIQLRPVERFQFYEEAKKAFCVVATSETAIYANVILKKGIIKPASQ